MADKGVKELREALRAIRILAITGAAIAEEGLELEDIQDVIKAAKKMDELKAGLDGKEEILSEIKDLDGAEVGLVISDIIKIVKDVKAAYDGEDVKL